jgi:hypothetical protein
LNEAKEKDEAASRQEGSIISSRPIINFTVPITGLRSFTPIVQISSRVIEQTSSDEDNNEREDVADGMNQID